jgi:protein-disulfide isomerase
VANRRNIIIGAAAAVVVVGGGAWYVSAQQSGNRATLVEGAVPTAPGAEIPMDQLMQPAGNVPEHVEGSPDAKVVVIEYLSPTCPHCARFQNEVYPELKAQYIDTGKIRYIPRPYVRNVLDDVVFMLAEAAGPERYLDVINTFFKSQDQWVLSQTPDDAMFAIAQQLGFTKETYEAALTNQTLFSGMEEMREQATKDFKVQGTPTFYVNGKMLTGEQTLDDLKAAIDPLLG